MRKLLRIIENNNIINILKNNLDYQLEFNVDLDEIRKV
uniref:Uncharacterized protein n=1 Tax=viral metagenome TaxID=1070528 RepID=A0A6C0C993_9ZZZZ